MKEEGFLNPQELVARIGIREGMHVADFGSGSGDIAVIMARIVGEQGVIVALDVLPSALESVQAKAKSANLKNVIAIRSNLEVLGSSTLDDASQDMVFMGNILWQSQKKKEVLEEALRILKSGGLVATVEWNKDGGRTGPPLALRIGQEELKQLAALVGLEIVETFAAGAYHYGLIAKKT